MAAVGLTPLDGAVCEGCEPPLRGIDGSPKCWIASFRPTVRAVAT